MKLLLLLVLVACSSEPRVQQPVKKVRYFSVDSNIICDSYHGYNNGIRGEDCFHPAYGSIKKVRGMTNIIEIEFSEDKDE